MAKALTVQYQLGLTPCFASTAGHTAGMKSLTLQQASVQTCGPVTWCGEGIDSFTRVGLVCFLGEGRERERGRAWERRE